MHDTSLACDPGKVRPAQLQSSVCSVAYTPSVLALYCLTRPVLELCIGHTAQAGKPGSCCLQDLPSRPRRNRRSPTIRRAISETHLGPENLLLPVFIHDGQDNLPIHSMPGVDRLGWKTGLISAVGEARSYGVNSVVLFPKVSCSFVNALHYTWLV